MHTRWQRAVRRRRVRQRSPERSRPQSYIQQFPQHVEQLVFPDPTQSNSAQRPPHDPSQSPWKWQAPAKRLVRDITHHGRLASIQQRRQAQRSHPPPRHLLVYTREVIVIHSSNQKPNTHRSSRRNKSKTANQNTNRRNAPSERPLPSPCSPRSPNPTFQTLPASRATSPRCSTPQDPASSNVACGTGTCTIGYLDGGSWRVDRRGSPGSADRLGEGRDRSRAS